jgi:pyrimidine-specific ribonucleoside hydrolase
MTNEIHGHTGIYSIIGAKMGIRALEFFHVGVNNIKATSYTGTKPPLSCLNDGVQISSGATIGQGLITIADTVLNIPTLIFECNNQIIKMTLKENIAHQMQEDIKIGIKNYGMSDEYWHYIEDVAIKYWDVYDRHEIFDIEKLSE